MLQQEAPIVKRPPIYLADPQPTRRALPIANTVGLLASLALVVLGYHLTSDGGAVLAAFGCAGVFGLVFKPTRVKTTDRLYAMRIAGVRVILHGDEETDRMFDEGR